MRPARLAAALLLSLILFGPAAEAQPGWPQAAYNPQPGARDLVLPMPCGGAMVFRPVDVPSDRWIDDRRVLLGDEEARRAFTEMPRYAHVAGAFADPDNPTRRHFWIGAYEVTEMQRAALSGDCPQPSVLGRRPAAGLTWADATAFAHAYTEWLYETAPDALPQADGAAGFLRLPTEAEWEFAARGGIAVSPEAFRQRVFPMADAMAAAVWYQGSQSANGERHPVGLLDPNPLGLHDMLGNVEEIVLEPFRLNRLGRLHGLAGGFVVKGGSFQTPHDRIRSAMRREIAPFVGGTVNRPDSVGFRLAIGAPVLASLDRVDRISAELDALGRPAVDAASADPDRPDDALADLGSAAADALSPALASRLERIAVALRQEAEQRAANAARTGNSLIRLGAYLASMVRRDAAALGMRRRIAAAFERSGGDPDMRAQARRNLDLAEAAVETNFEFYVSNVVVAAENFTPETLLGQVRVLEVELGERGQAPLIPLADRFAAHAADYRETGRVDREAWLADLAGVAP